MTSARGMCSGRMPVFASVFENESGSGGSAKLCLELQALVCQVDPASGAPVMQYGSGDPVYFGHWSEFIALFMFLAACIKHSQSTGCVAQEAQQPPLPGPREIPSKPARWPRNEKSYSSCHPNTHPADPAGPHAEAAAVRVVQIATNPSKRKRGPHPSSLFSRRFWVF